MSNELSGQFSVDSSQKNGTDFSNNLRRTVSVTCTASGTWNTGSKNDYGPEGKSGARNKKAAYPNNTLYALLAVNSNNEVVGEGASMSFTLQANESVNFVVNDTHYPNNNGQLTVDWQLLRPERVEGNAPVARALKADGTMSNETIDIAIIGAGVSGVYCAWRLKQVHPDKNIVVFEASDHIGGRLLSARPPGIPNMVAELGGMRVVSGVQPKIETLIEVLNEQGAGIELFPFPVDGPTQQENIAYLRGTRLMLSDFTVPPPNQVPYRLAQDEQGKSTGQILVEAIEKIVPGITAEDLTDAERRELVANTPFRGSPLHEQGFWNVLLQVMSHEGYQFGIDAGGYDSTLLNWNAADAIPWYLLDFAPGVVYEGFKNGFQQVPLFVAERFEQAGGDIRLDTPLKGFEWDSGTGLFQLEVKHRFQLQSQIINASQLILAMPRRSLDLLAPTSPPLRRPRVQSLISSVTARPLFKLFTTYENSWWTSTGAGEHSGRSVTDLPLRQTYYWPKNDGAAPAKSEPAMLMASYDDGQNVGYWDGLRPRRRQAWLEGREVAGPTVPFVNKNRQQSEISDWDKYQAPAKMVEEVTRQLAELHSLDDTPAVQNAAFRDWGDDPFGGGWNSWNIGVDSRVVKNEIIKPIDGQELYICGEAYSDAQGWVEGALQTADMVLEKFGLGPIA